MKSVQAYIQPDKLPRVKMALKKVKGVSGLSVWQVHGYGPSTAEVAGMVSHTKVEIFCSDQIAEEVLETIRGAAHTGAPEDGKIYLLPVDDALRISTGERGEGAC